MREIISPQNPKIRELAALSRKKERDKTGRYVVEGPNLVREALLSDAPVEAVFFRQSVFDASVSQPAGAEEYQELADLFYKAFPKDRGRSQDGGRPQDSGTPRGMPECFLLKDSLFDKAAQTETPQGIMAVVRKRVWTEDDVFSGGAGEQNEKGNVLVLDRLQDPGNIGTVLRTALGAGFSGAILIKGCGDIYSAKAARACAGALFRLPVLFCSTPGEALSMLSRRGKKVYATALAESEPYYKYDLRENIALIIGNEGNGVSSEFLSGADGCLTIPMERNLESLNAAVAAGILMYETVRQRNGG